MKVIGIAGKKGSGKTTFANMLHTRAKELELSVYNTTLAAPIKNMLFAGFPNLATLSLETEEEKNEIVPPTGKTARHLLQTLGTEWGRNHVDKNIWINLLEERLKSQNTDLAIVSDLRFENECKHLIEHWHASIVLLESSSRTHLDTHESENSTPPVADIIIQTTPKSHSSLRNAQLKADALIAKLFYGGQ